MSGFDELGIKPKIDRTQVENILKHIFSNMTLEQFSKLFINEFDAVVEYWKLYNGENTGKNISLLFNPHRLDTKAKGFQESIYSNAIKSAKTTASMIIRDGCTDLYDIYFGKGGKGMGGNPIISEFPPAKVRDYLDEYKLMKDDKILDPCAGWGGRMLGVSVRCNNYTCFEPSKKTYNGLNKLYAFIQSFNHDFVADINCLPFEDSKLKNNYYDFAITSPPYYDTENYSDEKTNSLNRYNTFEKWTDNFYLPLIDKTMKALKQNSYFLLNIGSRKYPLNEILKSNFSKKYQINQIKGKLNNAKGHGKTGEGETFYAIKNT